MVVLALAFSALAACASFGTRLAAHVTVVSSRQVKVSAPAGAGTVQVRVVTAGGTTPVVGAGSFSY